MTMTESFDRWMERETAALDLLDELLDRLAADIAWFEALDEQPVYSVILLISPPGNADRHLQAMENVFKHLQKERFRKFLRQCRDQAAFEDLLREADESPSW